MPDLFLPTLLLSDPPSSVTIVQVPTHNGALSLHQRSSVRIYDVRTLKIGADDERLRCDDFKGVFGEGVVRTLGGAGAVELDDGRTVQEWFSVEDMGAVMDKTLALIVVLPDGLTRAQLGIATSGGEAGDVPPPYDHEGDSLHDTRQTSMGIADPFLPPIVNSFTPSMPLPPTKGSSAAPPAASSFSAESKVSSVLTNLNPALSQRFEGLQRVLDELERPAGKPGLGSSEFHWNESREPFESTDLLAEEEKEDDEGSHRLASATTLQAKASNSNLITLDAVPISPSLTDKIRKALTHPKSRLLRIIIVLSSVAILATLLIVLIDTHKRTPPAQEPVGQTPTQTQTNSNSTIGPRLVKNLPATDKGFTNAVFSRDGQVVYLAGSGGKVVGWRVWDDDGGKTFDVMGAGRERGSGRHGNGGVERMLVAGHSGTHLITYEGGGSSLKGFLTWYDLEHRRKPWTIDGVGQGFGISLDAHYLVTPTLPITNTSATTNVFDTAPPASIYYLIPSTHPKFHRALNLPPRFTVSTSAISADLSLLAVVSVPPREMVGRGGVSFLTVTEFATGNMVYNSQTVRGARFAGFCSLSGGGNADNAGLVVVGETTAAVYAIGRPDDNNESIGAVNFAPVSSFSFGSGDAFAVGAGSLFVGRTEGIFRWSLMGGKLVGKVGEGDVKSLAVSEDGKYVVGVEAGGRVRLWKVEG
ncbi:hypothetical protein HDV00_005635 [Rhizophlyctis rosea]|nr:hypothetical protein HDV00_005635 [Rhizophlyctis rosea]